MAIVTLLKEIINTKYVCSGIMLFIAGAGMLTLGYLIRDNQWGKYGWAMILGVLLLGGSFLLFLYSLIRKMDYQILKEKRSRKSKNT